MKAKMEIRRLSARRGCSTMISPLDEGVMRMKDEMAMWSKRCWWNADVDMRMDAMDVDRVIE